MAHTLQAFTAQKCFILITSTSDDDALPTIHFQRDVHGIDATTPEQRIACHTIKFEEEGVIHTSLPAIFDLTCHVTQDDCHLTAEDNEGIPFTEETHSRQGTSCWLQPCPDNISGVEWVQMIRRIGCIVSSIGERVDLTRLFHYKQETNGFKLCVCRYIVSGLGLVSDTWRIELMS